MTSVIDGMLVESGHCVRLAIEGDRIASIDLNDGPPDVWIAPGLIDIQVNGYAGHDANAPEPSPATIVGMVEALWERGVTGVCPTICTNSEDRMRRCLAAVAEACEGDTRIERSVVGIHVEGPFISREDGPRGAHPLEHVRPPSVSEYRRWQDAARGRIRIVTISPEYPEAPEFIRAVTAEGVVVSIGHTAADEAQIRAAVDAGARLSTHLGNGAHALIRRHPNYIWEQLADDRLMAGFIFDGHHLPPSVMRTVVRAKGVERTIVVSDAIEVAGLPPGTYESAIGGRVELSPNGRVNLVGTPYLAGSSASLLDCVEVAMRDAGLDLARAIRVASTNPASVLGLDRPGGRGTVRAGMGADLTVFALEDNAARLRIRETWVGGEAVYVRH